MNNAMKTLAEMLDIEHSTMPREALAEKVCEAAIDELVRVNRMAEQCARDVEPTRSAFNQLEENTLALKASVDGIFDKFVLRVD
ncbi:hypothetical protein [Thalassolituus sp.]|uniref:hypothetical protein n=1 Tax=Thalassolituus sp. TaxID=2030822 RepID=UPI0026183DC6|nr:hypothetical protein [Thalassolituus sp.]